MSRSVAADRYRWRFLWSGLFYAVSLTVAIYTIRHQLVGGAPAYVMAILPALGIIAIIAAMGRYLVEEQDEYLRLLAARKMLWATGIALSGATIWGFLESFALVGHVEAYNIAVLWFGGQGIGSCINWLQGSDKAAI